MTTPSENFIAVRYYPGTGGRFLAAWLVAAKLNVPTDLTNCDNADASVGLQDVEQEIPHQFDNKFHEEHLSRLLSDYPLRPSPYFILDHSQNTDFTLKYVAKAININYDIAQAETIANIYINNIFKSWLSTTTFNGDQTIIDSNREKVLIGAERCWYKFRPKDDSDKLCNIHFNLLLNGDTDELIAKLSAFTRISPANFDKEQLSQWRTRILTLSTN